MKYKKQKKVNRFSIDLDRLRMEKTDDGPWVSYDSYSNMAGKFAEAANLLLRLLTQAEEDQVAIDAEWGNCYSKEKLYQLGQMPSVILQTKEWLEAFLAFTGPELPLKCSICGKGFSLGEEIFMDRTDHQREPFCRKCLNREIRSIQVGPNG